MHLLCICNVIKKKLFLRLRVGLCLLGLPPDTSQNVVPSGSIWHFTISFLKWCQKQSTLLQTTDTLILTQCAHWRGWWWMTPEWSWSEESRVHWSRFITKREEKCVVSIYGCFGWVYINPDGNVKPDDNCYVEIKDICMFFTGAKLILVFEGQPNLASP